MRKSSSNCYEEEEEEEEVQHRFITLDFHTTLVVRLRPAFSRKVNSERVENAVLISRKGRWNVKIGASREENLCFEDGWNQFAELHGLEVGDFIVFEHLGNMHFIVSIYHHSDSTTCEEKFYLDVPKQQEEEEEDNDNDEDDEDFRQKIYDGAPPAKRGRPWKIPSGCTQDSRQFVSKITDRHLIKYGPTMPKYFWEKNKLKQRKNVLLIGPSGEKFEVAINGHIRKVLSLGKGWMEFCKSNKMKKEHVCLFQLKLKLKLKLNPPLNDGGAVEMEVQIISPPN